MELAEILKALADPNRLRILQLLGTQTLCVCDLEDVLGLEQSNLSRHLAKLKHAGLVTSTKKGQFSYYTRGRIENAYSAAMEHLYQSMAADPLWEADRLALAARQGCCR